MPLLVEGKVVSIDGSDLLVEIPADAEKGTEAFQFKVRIESAKNDKAFKALATYAVDDAISVKGVLGAYNHAFQLIAPQLEAKAAEYSLI